MSTSLGRELRTLIGRSAVLTGETTRPYLADATESRRLRGRADAVVLPHDPAQVAAVVRWCAAHEMAMTPRGGGTGYAGGAVPDGGVVIALERLTEPFELTPERWRARVGAGVRTAQLQRRARESGLYYPPDPGAAESSQIGGNIATNAGGPHTLGYGVTGQWVTGLEFVTADGELARVGGPVRKDVAGYDIRSLLVGSEGTLAIITSAWLRLIPAPEVQLPLVACYPDPESGCAAVDAVFAAGARPAALEYLDEPALATALGTFPGELPAGGGLPFMVIAEADGTEAAAAAGRAELAELLGAEGALTVWSPPDLAAIRALWRWRSGVSLAVIGRRGGKASEDIVVPAERLAEAIRATRAIGARHRLPACSWGHAGDGNLHSTVMLDLGDPAELARAEAVGAELFALAARLGGSVSGEHGLGLVKRGALAQQWDAPALRLHEVIKAAFDPRGLLNPGKKLARVP